MTDTSPASPEPAVAALGAEDFVSLTTFRRSGVAVPTAVWIARDGDTLLVTTPAGTGKVKRIRANPRVELAPCTRSGKIREDAAPVTGVAEILPDGAASGPLARLFAMKYGMQYRIAMVIERLVKGRTRDRLLVRITLDGTATTTAG